MDLVRTTGVIDELLVRAAEKGLSGRLLQDYENAGVVDPLIPIQLCTFAMEGLLCGEYILDAQGHPLEQPVTDTGDKQYWEAKLSEAKEWWVDQKELLMLLDDLSPSEMRDIFNLPSRHAGRRRSVMISRTLLLATLVVESIDVATQLLQAGWEPHESCVDLRSDVVDWLIAKLDLPQAVATDAKEGEFCLGLTPSEHYSPAAGLYLPSDNATRVRSDLCHPDPMAAIIVRRTTIVHEAVHAVTTVQMGHENLDMAEDWLFLEGLAELCTLHYLREKYDQYEDWLYLPHSAAYELTTPPRYVEACRRIESIYHLTGDYRMLSALLKMKADTIQDDSVCVTDIIRRIEAVVQALGQELASDLAGRVLESVETESVAAVLYALGGQPREQLLDLLRNSDEAWKGLVEEVASA